MKYLIISIVFLICGCQRSKQLEDKKQTVKFKNIDWFCACARCAEPDTAAKYQRVGGDRLADHCVFIEADNPSIRLSDTLGYSGDMIEITGQFYVNKGYAKDYVKTEEPLAKARVFRYTAYKVIRSNHRTVMDELKSK